MRIDQVAGLLLGLGVGGAVGALAAVTLAASRIASAAQAFAVKFKAFMAGRTDPAALDLLEAYDDLDSDIRSLSDALVRAKRALTPRR